MSGHDLSPSPRRELNCSRSTNNLKAIRLIEERVPQVCMNYDLQWTIGKGFYGTVLVGRSKRHNTNKQYAVKIIGPASEPEDVRYELQFLQMLRGAPNIVQYVEHFQNGNHIAIITEFFQGYSFIDWFRQFSPKEVQSYMYNLLIALRGLHQFGITHGDIKPDNFLFNLKTNQYLLLDLGLCKPFNSQLKDIGTIGFIPIESILKYKHSSGALDIWAAGMIFLSLLSGLKSVIHTDGVQALKEFCVIFGTKTVREAAKSLNKEERFTQALQSFEYKLPLDLRKLCILFRQYDTLHKLAAIPEKCLDCDQLKMYCVCKNSSNPIDLLSNKEDVFPRSTYDLLEKLLKVNPYERLSAKEALEHPFFKEKLSTERHYCESPDCVTFEKGLVRALEARYEKIILSKEK